MKLNDVLEAYRCCAQADLPEETRSVLDVELELLRSPDSFPRALRTGDQAPDFVLPDSPGEGLRLSDLLREGPVVLKFYRGRWCAFCTLELRAYQRLLPEFRALGGEVIALSPQSEQETAFNRERDHLQLHMVTDVGSAIAREFGITYEIGAEVRGFYEAAGVNLAESNAAANWSIPLPAAYLIAPDRRIVYSFVEPNYFQRAEPETVLAELRRLQRG